MFPYFWYLALAFSYFSNQHIFASSIGGTLLFPLVLGLWKFFSFVIERHFGWLSLGCWHGCEACNAYAQQFRCMSHCCPICLQHSWAKLFVPFHSADKCCNVQLLNSFPAAIFKFLGPRPILGELLVPLRWQLKDQRIGTKV